VILVRMRDHDQVEAPVPRRDARIQRGDQAVGVRPAVHQQAAAVTPGHEDGVTLPDVEDLEPRVAVRQAGGADRDAGDDDGEDQGAGPGRPAPAAAAAAGGRAAPEPLSAARLRHDPSAGLAARRSVRPDPAARHAPAQQPAATPGPDEGEGQHRRRREEPVPWRTDGDARERDAGTGRCRGDHRPEGDPGREPEERAERGDAEGHRDRPAGERDGARGHRGRDDRRDREVHDRRDE
jgi:hypothetical protein